VQAEEVGENGGGQVCGQGAERGVAGGPNAEAQLVVEEF